MISDLNIKVDRDLCYACGICVERCILDNLRLFVAPCRQACPIDMNCQGYIRLLAQGREEEAAEEMRLHTPFSGILGRVCSQPCEASCERGKIDGPVHIRALKRYLADTFPAVAGRVPPPASETGCRTAVVGSGPAGLTAAYELRRRGHRVVVFEANTEPGGLLRFGIPSFRLPPAEIAETVGMLESMGVTFQTGKVLGRDSELEQLEAKYGAVVLALGRGEPAGLNARGFDGDGLIHGLDLLKRVKEGKRPQVGPSVLVIGGGNSAIDAALTCRRLGATEVRVVCLEERLRMPAFALEVQEAEEEGIMLHNGWGPTRLVRGEDDRMEVEFSRCLSVSDHRGCFNPLLEEGCGLRLRAHTLVLAIGQKVRTGDIPDDLLDPVVNRLAADPVTFQSLRRKKVFVCGDCHSGGGSVVAAMATAKEAALSVDRFLRGDGLRWGRGIWNGGSLKEFEVDLSRATGGARGTLPRLPAGDRALEGEVERLLPKDQAKVEAARCLSCGRAAEVHRTCWYCLPCEIECPVKALEVRMPYLVR